MIGIYALEGGFRVVACIPLEYRTFVVRSKGLAAKINPRGNWHGVAPHFTLSEQIPDIHTPECFVV